ncbi:Ribonuclease H-like domain containing protein, partial [Parasponia andersonii]
QYLLLYGLHINGRFFRTPQIFLVHWIPLLPGWSKIYTDGSSFGQPESSTCCGVFRNSRSFVLDYFVSKLGMDFTFEAELVGVMTAISIDFVCSWQRFWIKSDSAYGMDLLNSRSKLVP